MEKYKIVEEFKGVIDLRKIIAELILIKMRIKVYEFTKKI